MSSDIYVHTCSIFTSLNVDYTCILGLADIENVIHPFELALKHTMESPSELVILRIDICIL